MGESINPQPDRSERVLILAPTGRDGPLACEVLTREAFSCAVCRDMDHLCDAIAGGAGAAVIAEESLTGSSLEKLVGTLSKQPAWSDFPLIVLTTAERKEYQSSVLKSLAHVANYTLLERPLRIFTLVAATQALLKARRRQYQIRDMLERLQESEERIRTAVAAADIGSWRANLTTGFIARDANLNRILGYEPIESDQRIDNYFRMVHPDDRPAAVEAWQRAIESRAVYTAEFRQPRADGTLQWLREQGRFVGGQNGSADVITGVTVDISDRKRAEEMSKEIDRRKDEFLANMSHEIRTPMTSILGYSDILLAHLKDPDDVECVRTIKQSGNYLLEIVNDILDLAKIESGKLQLNLQSMSVPQLLAEIYDLMIIRAKEKGLVLILRYDGPLPETVVTDRVRLRQILVNLVSNAIKFSDRGSVQVIARFAPETSTLEFEVIDTGTGISKEMQEHLFEPFAQADMSSTREHGGTGLGLAITKRLAEAMGGTIAVATALGKGSAFRVAIPARAVAAPAIRLPTRNLLSAPVLNARLDCHVLVVDDRREIRYLVRQFIEEAGGRVYTVGDGESSIDAIRNADKISDPFDIVLMDIQMPGLDGYEATRRVRALGFTRPIIALTADAMKGHRDRCLQAGCDDYLSKPIDREKLVEIIGRYTKSDPAVVPPSSAGAGKRKVKILLVDDSEVSAKAVTRLLEALGHQVRTAFNGRSALQIARDFAADIIILDFKLPDIGGYELLKELKKLKSVEKAKFLAVSGFAREDIQDKESLVDFDHFITKPMDVSYVETLL